MVPPPPDKPNYNSIMAPQYPKQQGQRRNHFEVERNHPHIFPLGSIIMIQNPSMRRPIGPYKVVEYTGPLFHGGPPQYIVQPHIEEPVAEDWIQTNERWMFYYNAAAVNEPLPLDSDDSEDEHIFGHHEDY